ncbi:MAG: hypothetical protein CMD06_03675 [Flavobacteriales bacterium]|nr:hypothetical protein [Flavobacteriales bacterium]
MRLCLISSSFYPATNYGGPISSTWNLSKRIAAKNLKVFVSTTNANGRDKLDVETNKFIFISDNFFIKYYNEQIINKLSLNFIFGIWDDIKRSDIIYIQYLFHYTAFFALIFSLIHKKKIIICPRGSFSSYTLKNRFVFLKNILLNFIGIFNRKIIWHASSYLEKNDIISRFSKADVRTVNDGVDFNSFQKFERINRIDLIKKYTNIRFAKVSHVFFSMGRLHAIKRFDVLINAFSIFVKSHKDAKLIIAGGNDGVEEELRLQIIKMNLEENLFLINHINFIDKNIILNNCDYFTLCSEFESFGIVIAEAISCGKPVIISNKTPWKDIEDNNCGYFVENNPNDICIAFEKIINFKSKPELIKKYAKDNFDWKRISQIFINTFKIS